MVEIAKAVVGLLSSPKANEGQQAHESTIRFGASMVAGEYILPCIISNYKISNPNVRFDLEILSTSSMLEKLEGGKLDLVSFIKPPGEHQADEVEVAKDKLVAITPPKHEMLGRERPGLREVLRYPLILYEPSHEMAGLVGDFLASNQVRVKALEVRMLLPEPASVIASVSEGLGLSLCSEIIAKKAERAGMIGMVNLEGVSGGRYSIYIKRGGQSSDPALVNFYKYVERMSERFKGNLPCMMKMLYL